MGRINDFWNGKKYLMYGFPHNPRAFGRLIYDKLTSADIALIPVRGDTDSIDGVPVIKDASEAGGGIDGAYIVVNPKNALDVLAELKDAGIKRVFFQLGSSNPDVIKKAEDDGFNYETGCALTRFDKMGFPHSTHRWVAQRLGGMR